MTLLFDGRDVGERAVSCLVSDLDHDVEGISLAKPPATFRSGGDHLSSPGDMSTPSGDIRARAVLPEARSPSTGANHSPRADRARGFCPCCRPAWKGEAWPPSANRCVGRASSVGRCVALCQDRRRSDNGRIAAVAFTACHISSQLPLGHVWHRLAISRVVPFRPGAGRAIGRSSTRSTIRYLCPSNRCLLRFGRG
jgi:hypothetical protein